MLYGEPHRIANSEWFALEPRILIDNERLHKVSAGDRVIATTGDNSHEFVPPFRIGGIWGDVESTDNLDKRRLDIFLV